MLQGNTWALILKIYYAECVHRVGTGSTDGRSWFYPSTFMWVLRMNSGRRVCKVSFTTELSLWPQRISHMWSSEIILRIL